MNHKNIRIATKLRLLGIFSVILLLGLTVVGYTLAYFNDMRNEGMKAIPIYHETVNGVSPERIQSDHDVILLSEGEGERLLAGATHLVKKEIMRESLLSGNLRLYYVDGGSMYVVHDRKRKYYFLNPHPSNAYIPVVILISLVSLGLIFVVYYLIHTSIKPLDILKKQIEAFEQKGAFRIKREALSTDEVGEVTRAFADVVEKLNRLQHSRKLFLRNIMHEFKTPLAKGKFVTTLSDSEHAPVLEKIFDTQQMLLEGLGTIETVMSDVIVFDPHPYALIDVVENALDALSCEEREVEVAVEGVLIETDFYYFSLVLKNLISNGLKYKSGGKVKVYAEGDQIIVENHGAALIKDFEAYLQPFVTSAENRYESMGLGLYIVHEILIRMGRGLAYSYHNGVHRFVILPENRDA